MPGLPPAILCLEMVPLGGLEPTTPSLRRLGKPGPKSGIIQGLKAGFAPPKRAYPIGTQAAPPLGLDLARPKVPCRWCVAIVDPCQTQRVAQTFWRPDLSPEKNRGRA